jgi:DNA-directed RNA polymerase subunit F
MLPSSYISADLAQKILFIGKAIMILQSSRTPIQERIPADELQAFSEAITHLQQQPQLNPSLLAKVVEEIRECIAQRLWHLIVIQSELT